MAPLVELARASLGPISEERCYCLKLPAVLGGAYDSANFGTVTRLELLAFAGDVAEQINNAGNGRGNM